MMGNPGPNAIAYRIFRNLSYRPEQLQPVSNMIRTSNIVSAHPSVPVKSIPELIEYLKKNPDKVSFASSGTGSSDHLTAALRRAGALDGGRVAEARTRRVHPRA